MQCLLRLISAVFMLLGSQSTKKKYDSVRTPSWTPLLNNFGTKRSEWEHTFMYKDSKAFL